MTQGSSCAIITPMTDTGKLDLSSLRKLLKFHVDAGTDNLCVLGTTGESSVMTMDERAQVLSTTVDEVKGKIPILAGTGTINPNHVKEMTMQAIDLGCDASLVVTPYYVKPPQRALIKHFTELDIQPYLAMAYAPDPDLFIRTGGEQRISNFLLWQLAYTELYFTDLPWPDFGRSALGDAILWFQGRERRFGRISEQLDATK